MVNFASIKNIFYREIKLIIKDRNLVSVLLIAPIFYSFFYSSIYINKGEVNVPIVIVDNDNTTLSNNFVRNLDSHQLISVNKVVKDFSFAKEDFKKLNSFAILIIPQGFENQLKTGKEIQIKLFLNTTRFLISNDINKAVNEVVLTTNSEIRLKYFQANGFSFEQAKELIEPIQTDYRSLFSFTESYGDFLIPAVLILILHQTLLIGLAESFAKERENEELLNLFEISNKSIHNIILGKASFYLILYFSYAIFFFGVVFYLFKINFVGSAITFSIATLLMITSTTFLSIFISSFFERKIIAIQYLALSSYPIFLISGYSWPQDSLPILIKLISWLIPFTPYSNASIKITQMNASINNVSLILIHLFILVILYYLASFIKLNQLIKKS